MVIPKRRADCSRVTHPFAARVPRRALPLDLHVLSTPPAFVLSQDQTLQQNLAKQTRPQHGGLRPHISGTNHQTRKNKARHTVEFSKDTRTPSTTARQLPGLCPTVRLADAEHPGGPAGWSPAYAS